MSTLLGLVMMWVLPSLALAQSAPPPLGDLPPIPSFDPSAAFNPTVPFAAPMPQAPVTPIEPVQIPGEQSFEDQTSTLPAPVDEEVFDFFQPGYQLGDVDQLGPTEEDDSDKDKKVVEKKVKKARPTFQNRHNFRNQRLPHKIYKKHYERDNRHLPKAYYEHEYDAATFTAAARNDLRSLRALINAGRDVFMTNAQGETLAGVAARHNAHTTLRYLLAKGVTHFGAQRASHYDRQTLVALGSARTPSYRATPAQ